MPGESGHLEPSADRSLYQPFGLDGGATGNRDGGIEPRGLDQHNRLAEPERFHVDVGCRDCGGRSAAFEVRAMKDLQPSITFNLARGLSSLADQAAAKLAARAPMLTTPLLACADIVKQAIQENPEIPKQDITAVELARRAGVLPRKIRHYKRGRRRA